MYTIVIRFRQYRMKNIAALDYVDVCVCVCAWSVCVCVFVGVREGLDGTQTFPRDTLRK